MPGDTPAIDVRVKRPNRDRPRLDLWCSRRLRVPGCSRANNFFPEIVPLLSRNRARARKKERDRESTWFRFRVFRRCSSRVIAFRPSIAGHVRSRVPTKRRGRVYDGIFGLALWELRGEREREKENPTSRENIRRGLTIVLRSVDKNKASRSRPRAKINDVWTWNMATGYETFTGV